jgi:hypothetical protein
VVTRGAFNVLADGAEWIWNLAEKRFVNMRQATRAALGQAEQRQEWLDEVRRRRC